jgi:hypothetical protein
VLGRRELMKDASGLQRSGFGYFEIDSGHEQLTFQAGCPLSSAFSRHTSRRRWRHERNVESEGLNLVLGNHRRSAGGILRRLLIRRPRVAVGF